MKIHAAQIDATTAAWAAAEFHQPIRCSSRTIVSILSGTSIKAERSQNIAAMIDDTAPIAPTILSKVLTVHSALTWTQLWTQTQEYAR